MHNLGTTNLHFLFYGGKKRLKIESSFFIKIAQQSSYLGRNVLIYRKRILFGLGWCLSCFLFFEWKSAWIYNQLQISPHLQQLVSSWCDSKKQNKYLIIFVTLILDNIIILINNLLLHFARKTWKGISG